MTGRCRQRCSFALAARGAWFALTIGIVVGSGCGREEAATATGEETRSEPDGAAETAPVFSGPVTIHGNVVEIGTGRAIPGAVVIVLRPGVSSQQWVEARGQEAAQEMLAAAAVADARGRYEIQDLERGRSYTVMVTADGYVPAIFEGGLELTGSDPEFTRMQPVELDRA